MSVNVAKTKVLVFNGDGRLHSICQYAGAALETVSSFKYLGIEVCCRRGMSVSHEVIGSAATKAMWGMMQQTRDRDIASIGVRIQLFNSML